MSFHGQPPYHVAIIMDGNGRWAKQRQMPRVAGHRAGVAAARSVIRTSNTLGVKVVTLFAFSSENWHRPRHEVNLLMELFMSSLQEEANKLHENNIKLQVIGDHTAFPAKLQQCILDVQGLTASNTGLNLVIAANYGGRWDITQATRAIARKVQTGLIDPEQITQELIHTHLSLHGLPDPDLFIRTGGEQRISNYLLWQLAYTEFYFSECLWPDFGPPQFEEALKSYASRQRRFGKTSEQIECAHGA